MSRTLASRRAIAEVVGEAEAQRLMDLHDWLEERGMLDDPPLRDR